MTTVQIAPTIVALVSGGSFWSILLSGQGVLHFVDKSRHDVKVKWMSSCV